MPAANIPRPPPSGPPRRVTRRDFIKLTGGATLGFVIAGVRQRDALADNDPNDDVFNPEPFVQVTEAGEIVVICKHTEFGQNIVGGVVGLVAEELDAAWSQMRVTFAPVATKLYRNLLMDGMQATGNATSLADSYQPYREAGAIVRAMLMRAAANAWDVPVEELTIAAGTIRHPSGRSAGFGAFAEQAARLDIPASVSLKPAEPLRPVGRPRPLNVAGNGIAGTRFAWDMTMDGMLVAAIARSPDIGARLGGFDDRHAREVDGLVDIIPLSTGVAVIARTTWAAVTARDRLVVTWNMRNAFDRDSGSIIDSFLELTRSPGQVAHEAGNVDDALRAAATTIEAEFSFPYLTHGQLEPMAIVIRASRNRADIWMSGQLQTLDRSNVAKALGLEPEQVIINTLYGGGSFGRRSAPNSVYAVEAAEVARGFGRAVPIKVIWTRRDEFISGGFRPLFAHRIRAALDRNGNPSAWLHRIAGQSIYAGTPMERHMITNRIDAASVYGARDLPYAVDNIRIELRSPHLPVPINRWCTAGHSHCAYAIESFIDDLAATAGRDPVEYRLSLMSADSRRAKVLSAAAERAGWQGRGDGARYRGVAFHKTFGTYVAQVAELTRTSHDDFRLDRIICAVDCGRIIDPASVKAQIESGIAYGLGAALHQAITIENGRIMQSDYDTYRMLRMSDMPAVDVIMIDSSEPPGGIGGTSLPPVAPAVANAFYAATGNRVRALPLSRSGAMLRR